MPVRALIVLLLILNLGVALWWAVGEEAAPAPVAALPEGVERLRLLDEPGARPAAQPQAASATATSLPATSSGPAEPAPADVASLPPTLEPAEAQPTVCRGFGPYADLASAERARAQLAPLASALAVRQVHPDARGWQVLLRAMPDRDAATAVLARLVEAGFRDHYLMPTAADGTVDIALGRFGGEAAARRHRQALADAGFDAVAEPLGDPGATRYWIDASLSAAADPAALQRASGAARSEPVACAGVAAG